MVPVLGEFRTPQDVWRQGVPKAALRVNVFDPDDFGLPIILSYRANSAPLPSSQPLVAKVVSNDPATKTYQCASAQNRKEALLSLWWDGYYEAEQVEMKVMNKIKHGGWCLALQFLQGRLFFGIDGRMMIN